MPPSLYITDHDSNRDTLPGILAEIEMDGNKSSDVGRAITSSPANELALIREPRTVGTRKSNSTTTDKRAMNHRTFSMVGTIVGRCNGF